jgi:phospholipase/carboxylesterase
MENNTEKLTIDDWIMSARLPEGEGPHPVALLLHGLSGDEKVMWVFASRMPKDVLMLSPRGIYPYEGGGFSWYPNNVDRWPAITDFNEAVQRLSQLLDRLAQKDPIDLGIEQNQLLRVIRQADFSQVSLVGFSQGAAFSYAYALQNPERVRLLAGLAGFIPEGVEGLVEEQPLDGKKVFVTHGTKDETVPVERARHAVEVLQQAGADLSYCEEEVGHKLSAACFRSLGEFFSENKTQQSSAR